MPDTEDENCVMEQIALISRLLEGGPKAIIHDYTVTGGTATLFYSLPLPADGTIWTITLGRRGSPGNAAGEPTRELLSAGLSDAHRAVLADRRRGPHFAADITRRARWARDHNDGRSEPAWSTGERLFVALVLGDQATFDDEGYSRQEAVGRLAGELDYYRYDRGADTWLAEISQALGSTPD